MEVYSSNSEDDGPFNSSSAKDGPTFSTRDLIIIILLYHRTKSSQELGFGPFEPSLPALKGLATNNNPASMELD
jgi:hypothetical protein